MLDLGVPMPRRIELDPSAVVLGGFIGERDRAILAGIDQVIAQSPARRLVVPGGGEMSVAVSNCGALGWVSDRHGYRYTGIDPLTGKAWPVMPQMFVEVACEAAKMAGFAGFVPDACLVNRYEAGTKMGLHQDRKEVDFSWPIVSVSLGLGVVFLWGGMKRGEKAGRVILGHGDAVVWGGEARLRYQGVSKIAAGEHKLTGTVRYNLTFRKAG